MSYKDSFTDIMLPKVHVCRGKDSTTADLAVVNNKTGEHLNAIISMEGKTNVFDTEQFTKLFRNHIKLSKMSMKLSKIGIGLIFFLMENIPKDRIDIYLNIKTLMKYFNQKSPTRIYEGLRQLEENDIIKSIDRQTGLYEINPSVIFNGNRVELLSTIVSEKMLDGGWKVREFRQTKISRS